MLVVMRNEQEHSESEGSRTKKKKKQDGTSRPACSWVHFSREFIKEYTASHPESSGLKAATKAASDAWKLMSPEEKAKYTNRAREVWDKYLSTTPARVPKPRRQTKLVTRCSPGRLLNVLQRLTPEQKAAVKSMGFGSILNLKCRTLRRSLCLWLLEKFNTVRRSLEICGERIPLTPRDVELVMGLSSSGKDVVNSGPDELISELRKKYNATNRGISVRLLEDRLAVPEAGEDFKRSFVLYVLGTLLCPTARLDVSPSFLHFLTNMDVVHQYNWGKFLLERLVREVARYRQGKQRAVGGCLMFLQLFYYESVAVGEPSELSSAVFPCLASWGEEEISEREKLERELGGYGCGEVVCKERGLGVGLGYRSQSQQDSIPSSIIPPDMENYSLLEQVGYQQYLFQEDLKTANDVGEDHVNGGMITAEENISLSGNAGNTVCVDIEIADPVRAPCRNAQYGCPEITENTKRKDHEEVCIYAPCACPLRKCHFIGSTTQLSEHFSTKHWDSGRRFQYNNPLPITLNKNEPFLVLQAEKDGILFLLNKGTESFGHTVMMTCISPSSSKEQYLYDIVSERGNSCLRLKSYTNNFPGRVEGSPPVDFLLVPFGFSTPTGKLDLEVCVWNSTDIGAD